MFHRDEDIGVSYAGFPRDNTVFVFNLTPDLSNGPHFISFVVVIFR